MPSPHAGLPRAFDLSRVGYFSDFVLVPIAVTFLLTMCALHELPLRSVSGALVMGVLAWSFAEYWIHRGLFHGSSALAAMHDMHHVLPKDMIGVASWGTFAGFAAVWLLLACATDGVTAAAITAGVMAGYLFYCVIHVSIHHASGRGFGRYGALMLRLHQAHHRGGQRKGHANFGVSSPLWDIVFRTYLST